MKKLLKKSTKRERQRPAPFVQNGFAISLETNPKINFALNYACAL
ncbi:MAG: hypothetical protein Q4A17_02315 [Thermoguttaceae bacterium]|nr:hypothetical protein [Thermoguttaceae bacterium]